MQNTDVIERPRTKATTRPERPRLYKVILLNDDFTPRDFVVSVLRAIFRMSESEAHGVMLAAHQKGACVVAVYTRDVADTKALQGTEAGSRMGYPLAFTTERED
ncbi:MAG: ATP-dependent Clp protease adapter ClpS [Pseudomonadota bacterium]